MIILRQQVQVMGFVVFGWIFEDFLKDSR